MSAAITVSAYEGSGISFVRERIIAVIRAEDTLEIRGMYWFTNRDSSDGTIAVCYPFPVDDSCSFPSSFSVIAHPGNRKIRVDTLPAAVPWPMKIAGGATDSFEVTYRQHIPD